ncbi:alpha/beta hydrolase [Microbacterium elymi]|uniref:Alpha/beta hydrolase n=1 Tax=Microbacterium elymi TaxID=2909587 RepID=A0ABY5NJE7_9MICO|nr:alpha/beta hydrolase [Microbacterium elymi]UUT35298.1 alpha/beta hydrolase [Microbacterium elymi]
MAQVAVGAPQADAAVADAVTEWPTVTIPTPDASDAHLLIFGERENSPKPVVLWIHGGGYVSGSAARLAPFTRRLAGQGYIVASLDYSLAPESRHPVPVRQANAALGFIRDHIAEYGGDPQRVFVGGDSAGAQIASELAVVVTNPVFAGVLALEPSLHSASLRGVILYCGLFDMSTVAATRFPHLQRYMSSYTGYDDWERAPFIAQLSTTVQASAAYPPTFLTVGDADPFESQSKELARELALSRRRDRRAVLEGRWTEARIPVLVEPAASPHRSRAHRRLHRGAQRLTVG